MTATQAPRLTHSAMTDITAVLDKIVDIECDQTVVIKDATLITEDGTVVRLVKVKEGRDIERFEVEIA